MGDAGQRQPFGDNDPINFLHRQQKLLDTSSVWTVPIASLVIADSPRLAGEDAQHVQMLTESEEAMPPIWVHEPTRRVIDGIHRMRAAVMRGMSEIDVRFFHGSEEDIWLLSVAANIKHGLPLSPGDRTAAAQRIISSHPEWSDRMVASLAGLSPKRVAALRGQAAEERPQPTRRIGRDGRSRPVNGAQGRERAAEIIMSNPTASLRQIARAAGISPATAADVRYRINRGDAPVPGARPAPVPSGADRAETPARTPQPGRQRAADTSMPALISAFDRLRRDPSLRFNETGRVLLRMFEACRAGLCEQEVILEQLPVHCRMSVAQLSWGCAQMLQSFGERVQQFQPANGHVPNERFG